MSEDFAYFDLTPDPDNYKYKCQQNKEEEPHHNNKDITYKETYNLQDLCNNGSISTEV